MSKFPKVIQDFGNTLVELQIKRHDADYSPVGTYFRSAVLQDIDKAETAIRSFLAAPITDRRAFAAYVLLKARKF